MAASSSSMAQMTRRGVKPTEAGLTPNAKFKRLYGIPPKGAPPKGGWANSDYGFPVPPATHPDAVKYARAVLARAHTSKNFSAADLKKQIAKAQAIVKKHDPNYKPSKSPSKMSRESQLALPLREQLLFEGRLREGSINLEKGTARVVIIRSGPGNAGDRHYYSPECLEDAVERKVFEGAQNYVDHPSKIEDQIIPERMVEKLGGWFCDVALAQCENEQGITVPCIEATFVIEPGNELVLGKLRAAQQYAAQFDGRPYIGFSINAAGVGSPATIDGQDYNRVDRITEVISVDLVTRAGAGGKLLQLKESNRMKKAARSAAKTKLTASMKAALKEAGVGLSPEQDEALDDALGIEDGGALDQLLDQVTMGGSTASEAEIDGAEDPDEDEQLPADDNADTTKPANDAQADGSDDDDDLDEMSEADLKTALKAARKREREAKKREASAKREAATAKREAQKARLTAEGIRRDGEAARIIEKLNPPAAHRPRMLREMKQAAKLSEMESIAKEYATAFLGGGDIGAGAGGNSQRTAAVKLNCLAD